MKNAPQDGPSVVKVMSAKDSDKLGNLTINKPWYCKASLLNDIKPSKETKDEKMLRGLDKEKKRELKRQVKALKK